MNRVILIGRLTASPESRTTINGKTEVKFTLAVNRRTTSSNGKKETDFINCIAWNNTGETIAKYINKGQELAIEGQLRIDNYKGKDGTTKYTTYVLIDNFTFINNNKNNNIEPENNFLEEIDEPYAFTDDELPF